MRGTGWILPVFALLVWVVSVAFPVVAVIGVAIGSAETAEVQVRPPSELLATSAAWAAMVALGAMALGWLPGRILGRALNTRGFVPLAAAMLVPICLPAYVVYYAWWQSWPADSEFYRWIVDIGEMRLARLGTLWLGLVCWSWPLVSLSVAGAAAATAAQRQELLLLDGAGRLRRFIDAVRCDAPGLAVGALLVFLATLNNTTCFDLAEVFTFANELRAIDAQAGPRDMAIASAPAVLLALAGAAMVWRLIGMRNREPAIRAAGISWQGVLIAGLILILTVLVPIALFGRGILAIARPGLLNEFSSLYVMSTLITAGLAIGSGLLEAVLAVAMASMWQDHRPTTRWLASVMAIGWLAIGLVPGTMIGIALEAAYNQDALATLVYRNRLILVLGHMAAFGFIAALFGRWAAAEPRHITDLRRLDGAQTLGGTIRSARPRLMAAGAAAFAVTSVLAFGEIPVTAAVNPPAGVGRGPLTLSLLNDMHYQNPQAVMIAALGMITAAIIAAGSVALAWRLLRPSASLKAAGSRASDLPSARAEQV